MLVEYKKAKARDALELRMAADRAHRKMMLSQLSYHRWAWESIRGCFSEPQIRDTKMVSKDFSTRWLVLFLKKKGHKGHGVEKIH